jgi:hypothetical protein
MTSETRKINPFGKTRKQDNPYFILTQNNWEWRVLRLYQTPEKSLDSPYALVFCAVSSPMTFGGSDLGDVYVNEIPGLRHQLELHIAKEKENQPVIVDF